MFNEFLLENFSDGVRVIMITDRNKNKTCIISKHKEHFINIVKKEMANLKPGYRIYSTLIKRDMNKAIYHFKLKQLEVEKPKFNEMLRNNFYFRLETNFISSLLLPECRDKNDKKYLIDVDNFRNILEINKIIQKENIKVLYSYFTPNGMHFITLPFDRRKIEETKLAEVKNDGMILLGWNLIESNINSFLTNIQNKGEYYEI